MVLGRNAGVDIVDYLAMRLTYEVALLAHDRAPVASHSVDGSVTMPSARQRAAHVAAVGGLTESARG